MMVADGTYLGFDFGRKYVGIAVGQSVTRSASPLATLHWSHKAVWDELADLVQHWAPVGLVVGLPLNMDDTEQHITTQARQFGRSLEKKFHLPVHFHDERLSTQQARDTIFEQDGCRGLQKSHVDQMAATLVLQSWLEGASYG
jgi:putative holliday junction resolvase